MNINVKNPWEKPLFYLDMNHLESRISMGVPADTRTVPRPVNTIVDDIGKDGPKRYVVRVQASTKYVAGGNPQPKDGKVVGHIIDYKFVPVVSAMPAVIFMNLE